ncbi:MAG: hypothetical protein P8Y92_17035 [Halioglobus sp.]
MPDKIDAGLLQECVDDFLPDFLGQVVNAGKNTLASHADQQNRLAFKARVFAQLFQQIGKQGAFQPAVERRRSGRGACFRLHLAGTAGR